MEDINIGIKIPVNVSDVDQDKVLKLVKKFAKSGQKVGANPLNEDTIAAIRDARILEAKED